MDVHEVNDTSRLDHARTFIDTRVANVLNNPTFGRDAVYDSQRGEYIAKRPHHDLEHALGLYLQNSKRPTDFDPQNSSWGDVFDQIAKAETEDFTKSKKWYEKAWRKAGNAAPFVIPCLDFIPDDYGLKVLRNGLAVLFSASRKWQLNRECILQAFKRILGIIEEARATRDIYTNDAKLREKTIDLYKKLVEAVADLIGTLIPKELKHKLLTRFAVDYTTDKIMHTLEDVTRSAQALRDYANTLDKRTTVEIRNIAEGNQTQLRAIRENVFGVELGVRNLDTQFKVFGENVEDIRTGGHDLKKVIQEMKQEQKMLCDAFEAQNATLIDVVQAHNALLGHLMDPVVHLRQASQTTVGAPQNRLAQVGVMPSRPTLVSVEWVLEVLAVSHMVSTNDLRQTLNDGRISDMPDQGQAQWLSRTNEFGNWLSSFHSETLLVDGNLDLSTGGRTSPLSVFSAKLVASFLRLEPTETLFFFCRQHTAIEDQLNGPRGMMRCLISQLLLILYNRGQANLDFISSPEYVADLECHDFEALCYTFQQLVRHVPYNTPVICIIDSVSGYERMEWADDLCLAVAKLQELVCDVNLGPVFKLFMTCPYRSRVVWKQVEPWQRVSLRPGIWEEDETLERSLWTRINRPWYPESV
ncbi:uncharacterized protein BCR38DRAFT_152222 [Pseudomassariella vexata]|uniref:Fungal STAND N-terminal Goodbye domain-containing protein n=1 Tax=Pseudomassariella vexata TaxID=1141098 RepID=A0A1Y2E6U3_9PEZI|nr:uncharacterized protein BCR38DRAFT_152222 [Pseudomassariella vexata]ORY67157.1 hypothetical protein BCR38DRAFT_152222 [Pseudomassariella vexata]